MTDIPATLPRRSPLRRIGCTIALILWFALLLVPCALIVIATQGELTIAQGGLPGQQIRVWLINEADERGFGVSSTTVQQSDLLAACVQTNTNFLLWAGKADPLTYCECYARANADSIWELSGSTSEACQ